MKATGPGQSSALLTDVAEVLGEKNVPFMVIGAMAASFHGVVRASIDADAVISLDPGSKIEDLVRACQLKRWKTKWTAGDIDDPIAGVLRLEDAHGNRVDLLTGIRGLRREAFERSVQIELLGAALQMVGLEDFVALKLFAGGPKDIDDVRGALAVSGEKCDLALLRRLVSVYGREAKNTLEKLLKEKK